MSTTTPVSPIRYGHVAWITVGALAVFFGIRALPTGTNLSHMDFRATGGNVIEFCDPLNPQFISVVAARSPVTMAVAPLGGMGAPRVGQPVSTALTLKTGSGKPIAPDDLLVTHTKRLHLLIIDPTLTDYQHVHPEPGQNPGEWLFSFTPKLAGSYRVFADFTPTATARGLYANSDLVVEGPAPTTAPTVERNRGNGRPQPVEREGMRFALAIQPQPPRAGQPVDLAFSVIRQDGGPVPLQPVMGAFAHLVAFDEQRSGFAHLHPVEADPLKPPHATQPVLNFKLTIPQPGRYVIWAQVNLGGHEEFVPFWVNVQ
jgi:hypothetical protein